ncbi:DUF2777 family protein [Bacillus carboniphilus]|uniref:DUF2777 family protein n=1 Tax=Bacillus carboniphilus TaxID=86663 RepID=A0ABY9JU69_9BACI|nr:DUF2777 family protein [Bacillus carboniphilus]WLR42912.1 DUF2777 family protein [Bacillus carboniphilus]
MFSTKKQQILSRQERFFISGTLKKCYSDWYVVDDTDDFIPLDEYMNNQVEIWEENDWNMLTFNNKHDLLEEGKSIRLERSLPFALKECVEEISLHSLVQWIQSLNKINYSIYDCIYAHNQLIYRREGEDFSGISTYVFDNSMSICTVHHYVQRGMIKKDLFEMTLSTGERIWLTALA